VPAGNSARSGLRLTAVTSCLSEEFLTAGASPEGFDLQQLRADLAALGGGDEG
jgi:hypothetical protein